MKQRLHIRKVRSQRGASLFISLIMLLVLTVLGTTASRIALNDEKMARNQRDRNIALQAAEAALRDARVDITRSRALSTAIGASATCDRAGFKGFCAPAERTENPRWAEYLDDPNRSVAYGEMTGLTASQKFKSATTFGGVTAQPRYILEPLMETQGQSVQLQRARTVFRITAVGYGANPGTRVVIQEVYRP